MLKKLKKIGLKAKTWLLLGIVLLSATNISTIVDAATSNTKDWGDQFVTKAELRDKNHNPKTDFGIYDDMETHWEFLIKAGTGIQSGDTMTIKNPEVLTLQADLTFAIKDSSGNVIGNAFANHNTGIVTITFTEVAAASGSHDIEGHFDMWVHWDKTKVKEDTDVSLNWGTVGESIIFINPSGNGKPDDNEGLHKWGSVDANDPSLIHWTVRVNYSKTAIKNAVYTDNIGPNQELVTDSISGYHVASFDSDWNAVPGTYISSESITEADKSHFSVKFEDLTDCVYLDYDTRATDGGYALNYQNSGTLSGDNIESRLVDVYTPNSGGGGGGEMTVSVAGKKTWIDDNNSQNARPDAITVELYQNNEKIDTKVVTASDNWMYKFNARPKFDTNNQTYQYSVKEVPVNGYKSDVVGYDITNTYTDLPVIPNVSAKLSAKKILTGKILTADAFSFELRDVDGNVLQTKSNDSQGAISFDSINYSQPGTYQYTINEVKGNASGMTYDDHSIKAKVVVTLEDNQLLAMVTYDGNQTFNNSYLPTPAVNPDSPTAVSPVTKTPADPSAALPATGEEKGMLAIVLGVIVILTIGYVYFERKKSN